MNRIKIYSKNFGCKTNFADLFYILSKIKNYVDFQESEIEDSDLVILNSCSVTEDAEKELAKYVRRAKRYGKKVLVSGCLSNLDPDKILSLGADFVLGAGNYSQDNISKIISKVINNKTIDDKASGDFLENGIQKIKDNFDDNMHNNLDNNVSKDVKGEESRGYESKDDPKNNQKGKSKDNQKVEPKNNQKVEQKIIFNLKRPDHFLPIEDDVEFFSPELFPRHRVYLKIQEGCSRFCTFCSIPLTRGLPRFLDKSKVIDSIKRYYDLGIKEVVLVGTHLALYGKFGKSDSSDITFGKLVKEIAKIFYTFSDFRIRFASLSPGEIDDDFLEGLSLGEKIFCPHFHISVQSGSNKILRLMRRWHTFEDFLLDSQKLLGIFRYACIGTDIIVGFPGETEEDFKITFDNLKNSPVGHIHVFPFSARPRTPAYFMKRVPDVEVKARVRELINLAQEKRKNFIKMCEGQEFYALIEERIDNNFFTGTTENYIQVFFHAKGNYKPGDLIKVKLLGLVDGVGSKNFLVPGEALLH